MCDQVRSGRDLPDGKVTQIDDLLPVFGSPPGAAFLALVAATLLLRHKLPCLALTIIGAIWLLIEAPLLLAAGQDDVMRSAIIEGCRVEPYAVRFDFDLLS